MVTANSGLSTNRTHHRSRGCCPWTQQRTVASDRPRLSPLCSSVDERTALEALWRAGTTEHRLATRARAILLAADGWGNVASARYLHRDRSWVQKWRHRFAGARAAGLVDLPRPGRPRRLSPPATGADRRAGLHVAREAGRAWVRGRCRRCMMRSSAATSRPCIRPRCSGSWQPRAPPPSHPLLAPCAGPRF